MISLAEVGRASIALLVSFNLGIASSHQLLVVLPRSHIGSSKQESACTTGAGQWRTKQACSGGYQLQSTNFHHQERCFQEPCGRGLSAAILRERPLLSGALAQV